MTKHTKLEIAEGPARSLLRGHPWIFREAIQRLPRELGTGDTVDVFSGGRFVGRGLFEADHPIAVRIHTQNEREELDEKHFLRVVEKALAKRSKLFDAPSSEAGGTTTAYRVLNGEGDRAPGLVIDRYGEVAVIRLDGSALRPLLDGLAKPLFKLLGSRGVRTLLLRSPRQATDAGEKGGDKATVLLGPPPAETIDVLEHGMTIEVDVLQGQKTGAFLDQRENRRRVRQMTQPGMRVLNLFSYAGGFSVAAALGGAREVVSVDIAPKAHATAQRTFQKNGIDTKGHRFATADVSAFVTDLGKKGEKFDLVISDPPSYAPNEKSKQRALGAYSELHKKASALVGSGGTFCAASCSSHVSMDDFLGTLDDRALARSDLSVVASFGPPEDHPTLAGFPEGRYLKFVVLR